MKIEVINELLHEMVEIAKEHGDEKKHDDYVDAAILAMKAVEARRRHELREVSRNGDQGRCKCGRIVYAGFKVCPMCERRILWPVNKEEESEEAKCVETIKNL